MEKNPSLSYCVVNIGNSGLECCRSDGVNANKGFMHIFCFGRLSLTVHFLVDDDDMYSRGVCVFEQEWSIIK